MNPELPLSYDVTNYEEVIVIVNPKSRLLESHAELVKHDKSKDRFYIRGRLVRMRFKHLAYDSFPVKNAIALVPSKDVQGFLNEKKEDKKRQLIINIFYADILFITLDFNSLDWKKDREIKEEF